ncbi:MULTISPECIES: hypothetical protein [Pseudomonas]|uniref:hypothetical protein n=1 Tax=Pseudomonas TaxID=286 RepID=UPI000C9A8A1E|nr:MULTISPECIES: hypothetical protein [Pseudomonas]PNG31563.1 hypothetical protein A1348_16595 [Pseudomonas protegens]
MPVETQHLEHRVAALQSDLNTKDEQIGALTFSDNERELSRRSWFDEAKRLEKEVEALRKALKFYADREHYHFESGNWDTVSGEPLNILWCGDEPDFIEDGTVAHTALSASVEPINDLCAEGAHAFVPLRSDCVRCGALYSAEPSAPVAVVPDGYRIMPAPRPCYLGSSSFELSQNALNAASWRTPQRAATSATLKASTGKNTPSRGTRSSSSTARR